MKKIKSAIKKLRELIKIIFKIIVYKKRFFVFGIPLHGNIGDQAIIYATNKFLNDNYKEYKVIEIESDIAKKFCNILKTFIGKKELIFIHGGGYIGSLWLNEEKMFRKVVNTFKKNNIIVFPQTIFFSEDEYGKKVLFESKKIYGILNFDYMEPFNNILGGSK